MKLELFSFNLWLPYSCRFFLSKVVNWVLVTRAAGKLPAVLGNLDLFHGGSYNVRVITHILVHRTFLTYEQGAIALIAAWAL